MNKIFVFLLRPIVGLLSVKKNSELVLSAEKRQKFAILLIILIVPLLIASLITAMLIFKNKFFIISAICCSILIFLVSFNVAYKILVDYYDKKLYQVRQDIKDLINPNKCYKRLGTDILSLQVSENVIPLVDPEQEGRLRSLITVLRYRLTNTYGYIIPTVRMMDSPELNNNEYELCLRNHCIARGTVYPDKILVNSKEIKEDIFSIDKIKFDGDFLEDSSDWYWVNKSDEDKFKNTKKLEPEEVIIKHLEKIVMDYVDYIFDIGHVMKLIALADEQHLKMDEKKENWYILYYYFKENFDFAFVRKVLVTLLQKRISIKDITFILERTMEYSRITTEPNVIALKIENDINYLKNNNMK